MPKVLKLILVTATHHPMHKYFKRILEKLSSELNIDKEIKYEDYAFLVEYGETDELGMAWVPQLLVQLENNEIKPILTRMPLDEKLKPDINKAYEEAIKKIKEMSGD